MSCSIDRLKGVAEVVFLEMKDKFVENDFFKEFGQKWKVRNGAVVFQQMLSSDDFFNRYDDGNLQITWYSASDKRRVDVCDGQQEDVKVFKEGIWIEFTD